MRHFIHGSSLCLSNQPFLGVVGLQWVKYILFSDCFMFHNYKEIDLSIPFIFYSNFVVILCKQIVKSQIRSDSAECGV